MRIPYTGYVPAILDVVAEDLTVIRQHTEFCWWKKDSHFYYPSLLISAYYGMKYPNFRKHFEIGDDILFIGDSGGFQAWSKGEQLEPIQVLRWLENNADVALTLDVPPPMSSMQARRLSWEGFKSSAKQSARNYEIMSRNRENYDVKFVKVLHGVSVEELEYFYNLVKDIEFDGWSLAPKPPSNPLSIAAQFSFLFEKGELDDIDWLHILGVSGSSTMPLVYYIKSKLNAKNNFSFDSSSWATGYLYRRVIFPFTFFNEGELQIGKNPGKKLSVGPHNYEKFDGIMPCFCPICSKVNIEDLVSGSSVRGGLLISLHNLYSILQLCQFLNFLSRDTEVLREWIYENCTEKTIKAVEFIELSEKVGFKQAYSQFRDHFKTLEPVKEVQTTLW